MLVFDSEWFQVQSTPDRYVSLTDIKSLPACAICFVPLQIDAFQHMQHFVQGMQQQAQHAIAAEDQQHKQEVHKLMARSVSSLEAQ